MKMMIVILIYSLTHALISKTPDEPCFHKGKLKKQSNKLKKMLSKNTDLGWTRMSSFSLIIHGYRREYMMFRSDVLLKFTPLFFMFLFGSIPADKQT